MPNLPAHIKLAIDAANVVRHRDIDSHIGYFHLGATSPDIRALTKRARSEYHFVELDFETIGTGVRTMFAAYPELMNAAERDGPTRAFVAGYITHLLADESYIVRMFRPYFGESGAFEDDAKAKIWDRALQMDFDRRVWADVRHSVFLDEVDTDRVSVQFLNADDLQRWKDWVHGVVERGFSWDRLRFMARRIAGGDEGHPAHEYAETFIDSVPSSLDDLYDMIPESRVDAFRAESVQTIIDGLRTYLS